MDNLSEIYPFGKIVTQKLYDETRLVLPYDNKWFVLPKNKLSTTEIALLQQLFPEDTKQEAQQHPWYKVIFQNEPVKDSGYFRILQIQLRSMPDYSRKDWLENLLEMLTPVDYFFLNPGELIVIEKQSKKSFTLEDLKGLFATLDADFDATTKVFVGSFFETHENFPLLYQEEKEIFYTEGKRFFQENFLSLAPVALDYLTKDKIKDSALLQSFRRLLLKDEELLEIIEALVKNQGNVSSAAKELYMHRNTLQYRLDKFHEQTGFHLKNTEDLTLCYLLVRPKEN